MSWIDLVLLLPLLFGFVRGLFRGLILELAGLTAVIGGIYAAYFLHRPLHDYLLENYGWDDKYLVLISFLIIFFLTALFVFLLAKILSKFVKLLALGWANRLLGGLFGFLKMAVILLFLVHLMEYIDGIFPVIAKEEKENSLLYSTITSLGENLWPALEKFKVSRDGLPEWP